MSPPGPRVNTRSDDQDQQASLWVSSSDQGVLVNEPAGRCSSPTVAGSLSGTEPSLPTSQRRARAYQPCAAFLIGHVTDQSPTQLGRALALAHVDFPRGTPQPSIFSVLLATVASVVGALLADAAIVAAAVRRLPLPAELPALPVLRLLEANGRRCPHRLCRVAGRDPHFLNPEVALFPDGHPGHGVPVAH